MQTSMATHNFSPLVAQAFSPAANVGRPDIKPSKQAAEMVPDAPSKGATTRVIETVRMTTSAEKEALFNLARDEAEQKARATKSDQILNELEAGPVEMARGGGVGGDDRVLRKAANLNDGVMTSSPTQSPAEILQAAADDESAQYAARLAATRAYEEAQANAERQATKSVERNVFA